MYAEFHNPGDNFAVVRRCCEIRYDPLTGQLSRIFPTKRLNFVRYDWTSTVADSLKRPCPFCPQNMGSATPRFLEDFIPGGRLQFGRAVVVPNLSVYESHNGVVIMTPDHFVAMGDITPEMLEQSLFAALEFLGKAAVKDPDNARYGTVDWNYMPHAGGSVIHPHLQVIAGKNPCSYVGMLVREGAGYYRNRGSLFWADLVASEDGGPRYVGRTGNIVWLATFAPRGLADVTAVVPERARAADFTERDVKNIAAGMLKVINYYDRLNIPAFNMSLYLAGERDEGFWATVRMIGRFSIHPVSGSDFSYMQVLLGDPWTFHLPEEMSLELRNNYFLP